MIDAQSVLMEHDGNTTDQTMMRAQRGVIRSPRSQ